MKEIDQKKYEHLKSILQEMGSVLIAFSAGVDSTFLLKVATDCLGDRAIGVTGDSPSVPREDLLKAKELAGEIHAQHMVIPTSEFDNEEYVKNPVNRCYFCKDELYTKIAQLAKEKSISWIADGNNKSDEGDWRPGRKAAEEIGVRSPLWEAGMTKEDIRTLSRSLRLPTWDQPASPCLSSRFPYGEAITVEKLKMVEQGEKVLKSLGLREFRLRHHGASLARIEVTRDQMHLFSDPGFKDKVSNQLRGAGYFYVALDLDGYRRGRLNEAVST